MAERPGPAARALRGLSPFADLLAVCLLALLTVGVTVSVANGGVRTLLSLPLLVLGPGYALLTLVPDGPDDATEAGEAGDTTGTPWPRLLARVATVSLLIVSLLGLGLTLSPLPDGHLALVAAAAAVTLAAAIAAAIRRDGTGAVASDALSLLPIDDESAWPTGLLALAAVFLLLSAGYAGFLAADPAGFTTLHVRAADDASQETLEASSFSPGEPIAFDVGVENHEGEATEYAVVAQLEVVSGAGDNATVLERETLERFRPELAPNASWQTRHEFTPRSADGRQRVAYHLYRGSAPSTATQATAYRSAYVWSEANGTG